MAGLKTILLNLAKSKKAKTVGISVFVVIAILLSAFAGIYSYTVGASQALAQQAEKEYKYFQEHTLTQAGLTCQGQRYCSHFKTPVVDWCCYFVGYCGDVIGMDLEELGFSPNTGTWIQHLKNMGKYQSPENFTPRVGNLIFFDYSGRAHHKSTSFTNHIGIVVEINEEERKVTIIAGNESGTDATNSHINRYTLSLDDNTIACYGCVGGNLIAFPNELNVAVREVICRNETGTLYSEISSQYGSVVANDVGALSIGVYGWHGNNALDLLKDAYQNSPSEVNRALSTNSSGRIVRDAILQGANWSSYIPSESVCACIKAVLLTNAGKKAQDNRSLADADSYIKICRENHITNNKAIIYCCDILNQWGINSFNGGVLSSVNGSISLEDIYNSGLAWSDSNYNYYNRRTWTYNYIKELKI